MKKFLSVMGLSVHSRKTLTFAFALLVIVKCNMVRLILRHLSRLYSFTFFSYYLKRIMYQSINAQNSHSIKIRHEIYNLSLESKQKMAHFSNVFTLPLHNFCPSFFMTVYVRNGSFKPCCFDDIYSTPVSGSFF